MYGYPREKLAPAAAAPSFTLRRLVPRHAKAYLWICFLILVFGSMILSDNDVALYDLFCAPWLDSDYGSPKNTTVASAMPQEKSPASRTTGVNVVPSVPSTAPENVESISSEPISVDDLVFGSGANSFTPSDVVILFKTGATSLWRRVPIHLSTTLADQSLTPNVAFYSDNEDKIAQHPIIDVLANVSTALKSHSDFELYAAAQAARTSNLYLEAAAMDGDHYLPGGWRLDKYKFLPLAQHAAREYPDKKWYIYMEDDNYFFWRSLYAWLGTFDPNAPFLLGSPAARLGEDFAHGGSGFAISGAAMRTTFGAHSDLADSWESYAQERCCGDQVLSHVMAEHGVTRYRKYDNSEWAGLQALPTWRMGFGAWNWCSPLFNVHKTHQADVSRLWNFERARRATSGKESEVMRYRDLFVEMVLPTLESERSEWDNEANEKWFASSSEEGSEGVGRMKAEERVGKAWLDKESCGKACEEWAECLSWKYADDACGLSSTVAQGKRIEAGIRMDSGWMLGRIEKLAGKHCEPLEY